MAESGVTSWLAQPFELAGKRVWVAGHTGMAGAAIVQRLQSEGCEILTVPHAQLDLRDQAATQKWARGHKPDVVIVAAARVGGILANDSYPADFLYDNLMIAANVIHAAYQAEVEKLLFLGSSCIYPKDAAQPIREGALLTGALESTNEAYAVAKIAGVKLCEAYRRQYGADFISVMPCNLYGPGDTFDERWSHVIPGLMMKAHAAKLCGAEEMAVWGSGRPLREFLYVDDLADACVFVLKNYEGDLPVNIGSGEDVPVAEVAQMVADAVGFGGALRFDAQKPDGVFRKLMDSSALFAAGWRPKTPLKEGLERSYAWYLEQNEGIKKVAR